eukprot:2920196-Prymnesium_polylepis.1
MLTPSAPLQPYHTPCESSASLGYLNFTELVALGAATGGELPEMAYCAICLEVGADAKKGVTRQELLTMYTDAGMGDANRDFNLIFQR